MSKLSQMRGYLGLLVVLLTIPYLPSSLQLTRLDEIVFTHNGQILGATWNSDETLVLTWSLDGDAIIWEASTGTAVLTFNHDGQVLGARWNHGEDQVITWSTDNRARVWDGTTGDLLFSFEHDEDVLGARWNLNEEFVLSWSSDGTAKVWNVASGENTLVLQHLLGPPTATVSVINAEWDASEDHILTLTEERATLIWDATTGNLENVFPLQPAATYWNSDGTRELLQFSNAVIVRDLLTGEQQTKIEIEEFILGTTWSPDESQILTYSSDNDIQLWDPMTGNIIFTLETTDFVWRARWNESSPNILFWTNDYKVAVWNPGDTSYVFEGQLSRPIADAKLADNGQKILVIQDDDILVWNTELDEITNIFTHNDMVLGAMWNTQGNRILSWSADGIARIWEVDD